ncbi:response regulator [Haloarculaceae archaeon H-GB11]|nr:response regulator [Haloarculaceae archaeon H-GB11]
MTERESATVLVVDDESDVADSYAEQLGEFHTALTAYSGEEALEKLGPEVDVVLLDRRMPDISGDEVLAYIRERDLGAWVAMVTAVDPDFDIIEMPFDDYVVKPVSRRELLDTVDRLLTCTKYQERLREYYSLTVKYISLKQTKTSVELQASEEFADLERRCEELRDQLEATSTELDDRNFLAVIRDLEGRYQAGVER